MAGDAADVVVRAGGLEQDGGGAAAVGGDGVSDGACFVVISGDFIHRVAWGIVENCMAKINYEKQKKKKLEECTYIIRKKKKKYIWSM